MKIRVIYKTNGVNVVCPAPKSRKEGESEEVWLKRTFDKVSQGADYEDMDSSQLPSREYRNAWEKKSGGGIKINQTKVKKIKRDRLIAQEKRDILEKQAIKSLKDKGLIDD